MDIVMGTQGMGLRLLWSRHPRRVLYLQETSTARGNRWVSLYRRFDLLLSNDQALVEHPALRARARYLPFTGAWMTDFNVPGKTKLCSLLMSPLRGLPGHRLRHQVREAGLAGLDVMGGVTGSFVQTETAYHEYFFNLAIENSQYPGCYFTEKLFTPLAGKCIPIYWGADRWDLLEPYGFTREGVIIWDGQVNSLRDILQRIRADPSGVYEAKRAAVEQNAAAARRWAVHEDSIRPILCAVFGLS
ncbi:MAG: glycosyltransferase family 10 [Vicinamibacteria bacterium]